MSAAIDPITLSVIQAGLQQVCDEMDLSFSRAAFSPVIAEANDRSDGIYAADDGALIAQGAGGLPVFVGTMQYSTRTLIEMIAAGTVLAPEPDDIYIVNDPYLGGTHLMDVRFARPFYRGGEIFCWLSNTGHWPDTGGSVPGGFSASATAVEQEGLRLPPVKLYKRGKLDPEIYSIICSNIRVADQRIGDVKAQAAALMVGEDRLNELLDRYGDDVVRQSIAELRVRAAQQMRACISEIPDGDYRSVAWVDSDGVVNEPLAINLTITKAEDALTFDFSAIERAVPWADELGVGDNAQLGLSGDAPHLPRSADQCRRVRAAQRVAPGRDISGCALSAAGFWMCRGSLATDRGSGVRGTGRGAA